MINESLGISQIEKTNEKMLDYCALQYVLPLFPCVRKRIATSHHYRSEHTVPVNPDRRLFTSHRSLSVVSLPPDFNGLYKVVLQR
jgi:hypothetical protein